MYHKFTVGGKNHAFVRDSLEILELERDEVLETEARVASGEEWHMQQPEFLRSLVLNVTNRCNLRCRYCYANHGGYDKPGIDMTFDTAKQGVDLLRASVIKHGHKECTIGFFGGEPLLNFSLIKQIVGYAKSVFPADVSIRFLLTTNGTALTRSHTELFAQNNFSVTVSVDGSQETHDLNRMYIDGRGTYSSVAKSIEMLSAAGIPLTARITVAAGNLDIEKSVGEIVRLGVKRVTFARDYFLDNGQFREFIASLDRLFESYRGLIESGRQLDVTNITEPIVSIALKRRKRSHCNAGVSYLSISADGNVYRCPRFTGDQGGLITNLHPGALQDIDESAARFTSVLGESAADRNEACAACSFVFLCGGTCYHHARMGMVVRSEFAVVAEECCYRKLLFDRVLRMVCAFSESRRREFLLRLLAIWQEKGGVL